MKYKILNQTSILKERFVNVDRVDLEIDTYHRGKIKIDRFALIRPEVAAALMFIKETQKIVLIEQFRYSSLKTENGWVPEIPAGLVEEGEAPETCIKRETIEEAGYKMNRVETIQVFYPGWGFSDQIVHLFYSEDVTKVDEGGGLIDETEDIKVLELDLHEVKQWLDEGKIKDSKTVIALQWFFLNKVQS